jgi:hypothetical protein
MMRRLLALALLALLLPAGAWAQGIEYRAPSGAGSSSASPFSWDVVLGSGKSITLCNTADCATNYERATLAWATNSFSITTSKGGTATARDIILAPAAFLYLRPFGSNGIALSTTAVYSEVSEGFALGTASSSFSAAFIARGIQGSKSKTLTDAGAAVSFVRIAVPTGGSMGGDVIYTATSTNGTAALTRQARWSFAGSDTAGTVTCGVGTEYAVATAYSRANTLVCTMTAVTSTTNCDLQITCTDNLAAAQTVAFNWRLNMPIANTVTPQ